MCHLISRNPRYYEVCTGALVPIFGHAEITVSALHPHLQDQSPHHEDWLHEIKMDGYRLIVSPGRSERPRLDKSLHFPPGVAGMCVSSPATCHFRVFQPVKFDPVQRVRGDVSDLAQSALQSSHGNRARLLGELRQLDESLENASEGILQTNSRFAQASRDIEAVQAGREAATRGRSEVIIPAYQALRPEAQVAFRMRLV